MLRTKPSGSARFVHASVIRRTALSTRLFTNIMRPESERVDAFCLHSSEKVLRTCGAPSAVPGVKPPRCKLIVLHAVLAHGAYQRVKAPDGKKVDAEFSGAADIRQCVRATQRHQRIKPPPFPESWPMRRSIHCPGRFLYVVTAYRMDTGCRRRIPMENTLPLSRPLLGKRFKCAAPVSTFSAISASFALIINTGTRHLRVVSLCFYFFGAPYTAHRACASDAMRARSAGGSSTSAFAPNPSSQAAATSSLV